METTRETENYEPKETTREEESKERIENMIAIIDRLMLDVKQERNFLRYFAIEKRSKTLPSWRALEPLGTLNSVEDSINTLISYLMSYQAEMGYRYCQKGE